jgi:hypothetical protein
MVYSLPGGGFVNTLMLFVEALLIGAEAKVPDLGASAGMNFTISQPDKARIMAKKGKQVNLYIVTNGRR